MAGKATALVIIACLLLSASAYANTRKPRPDMDDVVPNKLNTSAREQTLTIEGDDFRDTAIVRIYDPDDRDRYYDIRPSSITQTRIKFSFAFKKEGRWRVRVIHTDDERESSRRTIRVEAAGDEREAGNAGAPTIKAVMPKNIKPMNRKQDLIIIGDGFADNATVTLEDLTHGDPPYRNRTIASRSSKLLKLSVNFSDEPAWWKVTVKNPGGGSDSFKFRVGDIRDNAPDDKDAEDDDPRPDPPAQAGRLSIKSVSPATPEATRDRQEFVIHGTGFTEDTEVDLEDLTHKDGPFEDRRVYERSTTRLMIKVKFYEKPATWRVIVRNPGQDPVSFTFKTEEPKQSIKDRKYVKPDRESKHYHWPINTFANPEHVGRDHFQCTRYAWGRARELTGVEIQFTTTSGRHAAKWFDLVKGLKKGKIPKPDSIIVWSGGPGGYGHVAYVESVDAERDKVTLTDANRKGEMVFNGKRTLHFDELSIRVDGDDKYTLLGFIYLRD